MLNRRNEITLDEIFNRIDDAFDEKVNVVFVCNYDLALEISEYLFNEYDIEDENSQLDVEDLDEYYVSLYFDKDEINFYCESARGNSGNFKVNDCGVVDYYVFLKMSKEEVSKSLQGDDGTMIGLYDLVDEDDDIEDFDDEGFDNEDIDDEVEAIGDFIIEYVDKIIENDLCSQCIYNTLVDLYCNAYRIGRRDQKLAMIEQLSEEVEYLN
jgi:hypothetical protein